MKSPVAVGAGCAVALIFGLCVFVTPDKQTARDCLIMSLLGVILVRVEHSK
jgi:hypothetical protein